MTHNCKQPRDDLLAYVETVEYGRDGASAEQCDEVAAHLEQCETCRSEVQQIRASLHRIREAPSPEIPRNLSVSVSEAIRRRSARRSFLPIPALAYVSLALVLFAATALMLTRDRKVEDARPTRTAQLNELLQEQQRWLLILSHTLEEESKPGREDLHRASSYVLARLDRSSRAFREGIQEGGLDPEMVPDYERTLRRQIDLLKAFYFEASSS